MKNNHRKSNGPKDAVTSKGPNAMAVRANASVPDYSNAAPGRKKKSSGAPGIEPVSAAIRARARNARKYGPNTGSIGLCAQDGRNWSYRGKRARVVQMLATMPQGVTQWDCWPWHTRLGGTIHALRCDGLEISTELEGDYRHARYRLHSQVRLIIQGENSEGLNYCMPEKAS